jgi:hypothetical protein
MSLTGRKSSKKKGHLSLCEKGKAYHKNDPKVNSIT